MSGHGTTGRYYGHGCRCDKCQVAARDYQREYRARRKALGSGVVIKKPVPGLDQPALDSVVARVGQDFPALGALVRSAWTAGA